MAAPKAKLPYDLELTYHEKIKEIADITTKGNKTQVVRNAINMLYEVVMMEEEYRNR